MKLIDLAVTFDKDGWHLLLHRADCPLARSQADNGEPVMTMFGCNGLPSRDDRIRRHDCLKLRPV